MWQIDHVGVGSHPIADSALRAANNVYAFKSVIRDHSHEAFQKAV